MNTGKAIRTLMILAATGLFATGCVTAKQASQAASEGTQATPCTRDNRNRYYDSHPCTHDHHQRSNYHHGSGSYASTGVLGFH